MKPVLELIRKDSTVQNSSPVDEVEYIPLRDDWSSESAKRDKEVLDQKEKAENSCQADYNLIQSLLDYIPQFEIKPSFSEPQLRKSHPNDTSLKSSCTSAQTCPSLQYRRPDLNNYVHHAKPRHSGRVSERPQSEKRCRSREFLVEEPPKRRRMSENRHDLRSQRGLIKEIPDYLEKIKLGPFSERRICIFNVSPLTRLDMIEKSFSRYGRITASRRLFDRDPHHADIVSIEFEDPASTKKAVEMNASLLDGRHIGVTPCHESFNRIIRKIKVVFPYRISRTAIDSICSCDHESLGSLRKELINGFKVKHETGYIGFLLFRTKTARTKALDILKYDLGLKAGPVIC